jgi:6-phosphogluconolactonase
MAARIRSTRRTFIQNIGSLTALGGFASIAPRATAAILASVSITPRPRFAFVAAEANAIHVFAIAADGTWRRTQTVASASPAALVLSPNQRFLYVVNSISRFNHLPTGSVEAFAVDSDNGSLRPVNRQALALSAMMPKHLAVAPDGRQLAVAATGGAAYNLLPLLSDGSIGRVSASMKQLGAVAGPSTRTGHPVSAQPLSVLFHQDGTLFGADQGSDRISSFAITGDGALLATEYQTFAPGSGTTHLVAHPSGDLLFIAGALRPILSSIRCQAGSQPRLRSLRQVRCSANSGGIVALAIHPSGSLLFAADATGITVVRTNSTGAIELMGRHTEGVDIPVGLVASPDGTHLFALNRGDNSLTRFRVDFEHARLLNPVRLATVDQPTALVLKHL